jgi:hypothetical protein
MVDEKPHIRLFAKAHILDNYILVKVGDATFRARPVGWDRKGLVAKLKMQFTLKYQLYQDEILISQLTYDDIRDRFIIEKNGAVIAIKPQSFTYNKRKFRIENRFMGFDIIDATEDTEKSTGKGKFGVTSYSVELDDYPEELSDIIREIAVLYVVKRIVWSMLAPI